MKSGELDFRTWVKENILHEQGGADWPTKFTITAWYIWKWRNAFCFDTPEKIHVDKIRFLLRRFAEVLKALDEEIGVQQMSHTNWVEIGVHWKALPPSWVVLNADGVAKGNPGPTGGGGVLRGHRGEWILGFAENMGISTSMKAELKALLRGLKLATEKGVQKLWV